MSAFTPGPWYAIVRPTNTEGVAMAYDIGSNHQTQIAYGQSQEHCDGIKAAELLANARLIAQSPDMHGLLTECRDYLSCIPESAVGGDDDAVALVRRINDVLRQVEGS